MQSSKKSKMVEVGQGNEGKTKEGGARGKPATHRKEKITNIMSCVNRQPNIGKVKPITAPDQRQRDDMMRYQLLKVLPRLFHSQHQHDRLLGPVRRLEQVIKLQVPFLVPVREILVHPPRVVVPNRRPAHHEHARGAENAKVQGRVHLLHEARLLPSVQAGALGEALEELLHEEFAGEGEDDRVEGDERQVPVTFAVELGRIGGRARFGVGEEDEVVYWIGFRRVEGIEREEDEDDDGR